MLRAWCLSFLTAAALCGQGPFELARPALRIYGMEDGLPSGTVYAFAQDTKGRLWAGTVDGPAYLTGHGWVRVHLPKESTSQYVRALLASRDGSLWFATQDGGVWRLDGDHWTHYRGGVELPSDHAFALAETVDSSGGLVRWVGTQDRGIATFSGGRWRSWPAGEGLPHGTVWRIREIHAPDGSRKVWAATEGGLCALEGDRWRVLGAADGVPAGDVNDILDLQEADGSRTVWISHWERGLSRWTREGWTRFDSGRGFPARFPTSSLCVTKDAAGRPTVWIGTLNKGLWWFRDGKWHVLGRDQGFQTAGILGLHPVAEGKPSLLLGTRGDGVASLDLGGWRTLDEPLGLPGMEVSCFAETVAKPSGEAFWVGTTMGLACYRPGGPVERVGVPSLPSDYIISLLSTGEELWVGTLNGLARRTASGWRHEDGGGVLPEGMIIDLLETRSRSGVRTVWVGTPKGLCRFEGGRWTRLTTREGLPHDYVTALCTTPGPDGEPTLWVGTRGGGVGRYQGGAWTTFGANAGMTNGTVYALRASTGADGRRWLWAGTLGGGLGRLDIQSPAAWEVFTQENTPELPSNYIQRIEEDRQGRLYLSTARGVIRLRLDWRSGAPRPAGAEAFTQGDGLPTPNGNLGASLRDAQGRIWIGTSRGAAVLDPAIETLPPPPPPPVFERVLVSDHARPLSEGQRLSHRDAPLRVEFSMPVIHRKEDARYRTQLVGLEPMPRPWQKETWREFAALPAGHYTLRVWGRTYDGRTSGPVEHAFLVAPAPWRHPFAYGLYGLAGVGGFLALLRLRTRVLRERTEALEAAVRERTRIIAEQSRALEDSNRELQGRNQELSTALTEVKTLRGLIPICAYCKKIRDDRGSWDPMEHYISQHSDAQFSHGICPDCKEAHFRDVPASPPGEA